MDYYYTLRKAGNRLLVKKKPEGTSDCFLANFTIPKPLDGETIMYAKALQLSDEIEISPVHLTPYTSRDLIHSSGRELSTFVVEHSKFVHKFIMVDGLVNRCIQPPTPTAAMVANVCEELVSLQNWLYITMGGRNPLLINGTVGIYLTCGRLIMDKFWEDRSGFERTFQCANYNGSSIEVYVNEATEIGSFLLTSVNIVRGVALARTLCNNPTINIIYAFNNRSVVNGDDGEGRHNNST